MKVGDKLVMASIQRAYSRDPEAVYSSITITKVGRKWAHFNYTYGTGRFHIKERWVCAGDYTPVSSVWNSAQDHKDYVALSERWKSYVTRLNAFRVPEGMTADRLDRLEAIMAEDDSDVPYDD